MTPQEPKTWENHVERKVISLDDISPDRVSQKPSRVQIQQQGQRIRKAVHATPYCWTDPRTIPTREWVYGRHLIRKFVSATVAPGGVGKTSLAIVETLAMVTGQELLNQKAYGENLRVWYLNLEDPRDEITRQVQAVCLHYEIEPAELGDRLYVDSGREQEFVIAETLKDGTVLCRPVIDSITSELKTRNIDVLIIDPFVSSHMVSENDNGAMDLVVKQWGKIADAANCSIHLIHHTRKSMGGEITAESSRGAKALTDGCRSVRAINRMSEEEATKAGVDNHRLYFRTYNDKANLAPPSEKADWFKLESVDLGNGGSGLSDTMGVVTAWEWPNPFDGMTVADLRKVQEVIHTGDWRESAQSDDWAGKAVAQALSLDLVDAHNKAKVKTFLRTWIKSGALVVVKKTDENRKGRPFVEVGEWANV